MTDPAQKIQDAILWTERSSFDLVGDNVSGVAATMEKSYQ